MPKVAKAATKKKAVPKKAKATGPTKKIVAKKGGAKY